LGPLSGLLLVLGLVMLVALDGRPLDIQRLVGGWNV
jgi:hypothetical protein